MDGSDRRRCREGGGGKERGREGGRESGHDVDRYTEAFVTMIILYVFFQQTSFSPGAELQVGRSVT